MHQQCSRKDHRKTKTTTRKPTGAKTQEKAGTPQKAETKKHRKQHPRNRQNGKEKSRSKCTEKKREEPKNEEANDERSGSHLRGITDSGGVGVGKTGFSSPTRRSLKNPEEEEQGRRTWSQPGRGSMLGKRRLTARGGQGEKGPTAKLTFRARQI